MTEIDTMNLQKQVYDADDIQKLLGIGRSKAYALCDLIIPNIDYDIKMRFVSVEYLDGLLERTSKACVSAGNKGREILNLAMKEAVIEGYVNVNPVPETRPYKRKKPNIVILSREKIKILF